MSILLATALLAAPATLPSCSWDRAGVNPFVGDVVAAVDRYSDIPAEVRARLKSRMAKRQYDEIATITRDAITGNGRYEAAIRDMHFGAGQVCNTVTRDRWSTKHQERGLVYCESSHCIIVPTVCRNVSRITRLDAKAEAAEASPAVALTPDKPADDAPVVTAGGDEGEDARPRLRHGGAFGGSLGPSSAVAGSTPGGSGPSSSPTSFGDRLGGAIGSVLSSLKNVVRETIDTVATLPLLGSTSSPAPASPIAPETVAMPAAPASPASPDQPAAPGTPSNEASPDTATSSTGVAPGDGGQSGSSADPGLATPAGAKPGKDGSGGNGGNGGTGDGGGTTTDPVKALIDEIERQVDSPVATDEAPGTGGGGSALPGSGGAGTGGGIGFGAPQGAVGELPEPGTAALVLIAGLAVGAAARRRG